jgi:putative ABC transport system permease protein
MLMHQLRYAVRALRKNPSFSLPAVLALALGIGAVTTIFSVVATVLLRPLPYPDADRLISVSTYFAADQVDLLTSTEFLNWERANHVLDSFAAVGRNGTASLIDTGGSERILTARVTANFLATLRVSPVVGRDFLPEEGRSGAPDVVILSYGLWQSRFGGEPGVVGKSVNIDGTLSRVIGVLPKGFVYLPNLTIPEALTPLQISPDFYWDRNQMRGWQGVGRLKPGVSVAQARANFDPLLAAARRDFPRLYQGNVELRVVPYRDRLTVSVRLVLMLLLGAVGCVLLIACGNVGNLLLARGAARRKEIAIRVALGASRWRLVRQLLTESLVLALLGGVAGTAIAFIVVRILRASAAVRFPRIAELTVDWRVLAFAFLLSLATGMLFGLVPAWSASRIDIRGVRHRPALRGLLLAAQLGLSLVLLVSSVLLFQSLWRLEHKNLGFQPDNLVAAQISLRGSRYAANPLAAFYPDLRDRVLRIPGTVSVAFADGLPPDGGCCATVFVRDGVPRVPGKTRSDLIVVRSVTPSYFETVGIPLKRGRFLTATDRDAVVINETMARHFFPGENPLGVRVGAPRRTIVGIVADVKNDGLSTDVMPEMIVPLGDTADTRVLVRSMANAGVVASTLRQELRRMDPRMLVSIRTMREQFANETSQPRFQSAMFGAFAGVALLLAMVGIYGVAAFAVASRTREIGIRMALGADAPHVLRLILRDLALPIAAGILTGAAGSVASSRYLATLLYDIRPTDPLTYAGVAALMAAAAIMASLAPARRACRLDPVNVLRAE